VWRILDTGRILELCRRINREQNNAGDDVSATPTVSKPSAKITTSTTFSQDINTS
jgi:hypothetical protein